VTLWEIESLLDCEVTQVYVETTVILGCVKGSYWLVCWSAIGCCVRYREWRHPMQRLWCQTLLPSTVYQQSPMNAVCFILLKKSDQSR